VFGGVGQGPQVDAFRRNVDIIVATPGRLLDLMAQRHAPLEAVEVLCSTRPDRMLDMGFIDPIRPLVAALPRVRQNLMFSATMPPRFASWRTPSSSILPRSPSPRCRAPWTR
jgi:ATP-dependent RNA helicase RhlE